MPNLDIKFLSERRAEALKRVFNIEFVMSVSDEDLKKLAIAYRQPNAEGQFTDFAHVLSRYAEQLAGHEL